MRPSRGQKDEVETAVAGIIDEIRRRGDAAVREFTRKLDGARRSRIEIERREWEEGLRCVSRETVGALRFARRRIAGFARLQKRSLRPLRHVSGGIVLEQKLLPVERAGVYVPAGRHPLCSTVLMAAVPARIAGCREVMLCTPPRPDGAVAPEVLAAARIAGVDRVFAVGGAQAIAAMAFGTRTVPAADLIVGPGSRYVAAAKEILSGRVGIDFVAGPTELLVIADRSACVDSVASDLLAQAEHDPLSRLWLVALDARLASAVERRLRTLLDALTPDTLNRRAAVESLSRMETLRCGSREEACRVANTIAPEHLSLQVASPRSLLPRLRNYGSLFIGNGSAVALGDYVTGPNHILPTSGAARHTGGLSVLRFLKIVTVQEVRPAGLRRIAGRAMRLAAIEGLEAHADSIAARLDGGWRERGGVIFDFNGVLVDDEELHWKSIQEVVAPLGIELSRRLYDARYLAGDDRWAMEALLRDAGLHEGRAIPSIDSLIRAKRKAYSRLCGADIRIEESVVRSLRSLARRVPLAIVSGAAREEIDLLLGRARIRDLFRIVVAAEDVQRCKPHPEGYLLALRRLGVTRSEARARRRVVAVEDSPGGIKAARAAGLTVVAIPTTYDRRALLRAGASRVIPSVAALKLEDVLGTPGRFSRRNGR